MNSRLYKILLVCAAALLLAVGGQFQKLLNRERVQLGFTPLPNDPAMPPMLALTTQALGGFRGLIANALWIRANDLQLEDKYFEMVQLARWITLLEPRFVQVWTVQAWNMAYNISVKFTDAADRWRWVKHGIELLRDDALRYNPDEALIYRELAWFYQHKMGANLDDAHFYYKTAWADEMEKVLNPSKRPFNGHPNFEELINPQTEAARSQARNLRETYKLDPRKMKEVDDHFGPLDWRMPEAHAIYWAFLGLAKSKPQDQVTVRRAIYQSMQLAFQRGNLQFGPNGQPFLSPNLEIIPNASAAYEEMIASETDGGQREGFKRAHKNFLKQAVYELYIHNRVAQGEKWLKELRTKYPDALPANMTLSEYAVTRAMGEMSDESQTRVTSLIQAFVTQAYVKLIEDDDEQASAYMQRAQEMSDGYARRDPSNGRLRLTPLPEVKKQVLHVLLDPATGLTDDARARLRTKLGLPADNKPPAK